MSSRYLKRLSRALALIVGLAALTWVVFFPRDTNSVLVVLWTVIAARGLFKALVTLRRVRNERMEAVAAADPLLKLIADGNVRRNVFLAVKLAAFLLISLSVLTGQNNVTVSRVLIVLILLLMSGGAEMDADEIERFDDLSRRGKAEPHG